MQKIMTSMNGCGGFERGFAWCVTVDLKLSCLVFVVFGAAVGTD